MKKLIFPTILTLVACAILLSLGTWQMRRMEWKQEIIRQATFGIQSKAVDYIDWRTKQTAFDKQFIKVRFSGQLRHEGTVYVHVIRGGHLGYLVMTPVLMKDGKSAFVNRGFILQTQKNHEKLKTGTDFVQREAFIRLGEKKSYFTPDPALHKRVWFTVDLPSKTQALGASAIDNTHYLELFTVNNQKAWPSLRDPGDYIAAIPNRHFEYMLTWFGLAFSLLCVYLAYARSSLKQDK